MLSHFNSQCFTQLCRSKWLNFLSECTEKKNWVILTLKLSHWRNYNSSVQSDYITGEYLSQFDSQCWVNLTLNVESIWLSMLSQFDYQCWVILTLNVWLSKLSKYDSMLSQFDSQCWANMTQCWANLTLNVEPIWLFRLSMLSQFDSNILQLPTLPGCIIVPPVTQLCMSKWVNFFLSVYYSLQT